MDDLVAGLTAQLGIETSAPTAIDIDGWILDLDGARAVTNAGSVFAMPPAIRAQVDEILASLEIG